MFALFVVYLAAVAAITLSPAPAPDETLGFVRAAVTWLNAHGIDVTYNGVEFVANIVMFVPFGVLVGRLWPKRRWWQVVVFAACVSIAIEIAQGLFLPSRVADVRDVVANTMGGVIGIAVLRSALTVRPTKVVSSGDLAAPTLLD
ncbi:VanZ family protein [Cellulomonas sp. P5_C6]